MTGKAVKINDADYDYMNRMIRTLQERYGRQFDRTTFISMMFDFIWSYPNGIDIGNCTGYNEEQIMRTRWYYYTQWCWGKGIEKSEPNKLPDFFK